MADRSQPRRGRPVLVSAPSGTGKTTVCRAVVDRDLGIVHSISYTTRRPRQGEQDGVHYHFVTESVFRKLIEEDAFLEWAEYRNHLYGTRSDALDEQLDRGVDVLLEIEIQGARQVRARRTDARLIFLLPPSLGELENRLRGRGTDSDEVIAGRLEIAQAEMRDAVRFDYTIVNEDKEQTIGLVLEILRAERAGKPEVLAALEDRFGRSTAREQLRDRFGIDL